MKPKLRESRNLSRIDVVITLFLGIVVVSLFVFSNKLGIPAKAQEKSPAPERVTIPLPPLKGEANLFFASAEIASLSAPQIDKAWQTGKDAPVIPVTKDDEVFHFGGEVPAKSNEPQGGTDARNIVWQSHISPDGQRIAVQTDMGPYPVVWLIDLSDRTKPSMTRLVAEGYGQFLNWQADSRHLLYAADDLYVNDPGLWVVDVIDGSHKRIEIPHLDAPQALTAAAVASDGTTIVYATTGGMGTGSEIWLAAEGQPHRKLWSDVLTVVGNLSYSPDSKHIAFINLLDAPVPFAKAGLWTLDVASEKATFLTVMDGGHGQLPVWSRDSTELYFVKRDNLNDDKADYDSKALVSSIRAISISEAKERELVPANGARQVDLSLTPNNDLVFSSNRSGVAEIWAVSSDGKLQQVTADGSPKRFPLFVGPVAQP